MKTLLIILGAGGHAKVLMDTLQNQADIEIVEILAKEEEDKIMHYPAKEVQLVNALGSINIPHQRQTVFNKFKEKGYTFFSVIHPSAILSKQITLGEGVQIMAGSILQPGSFIGNNVIINTRASIDHDCYIHSHVHIAPGTVLSGSVKIGETCHIGTGAVIVQGITLGSHCLVGAGAVVTQDAPAESKLVGVPAKRIPQLKEEVLGGKLAENIN